MSTTCVIGLLWGDEGKGKVIDLLAADADVVARYAGGHNAGHTLIHNGARLVLHLIPSGILHAGSVNVIGNGVVVDPFHLRTEIERLRSRGVAVELGKNLLLAEGAPLILPVHQALDAAAEASLGDAKIGTTKRGIGPAYADRAARCGLRVGDLLRPARLQGALARFCAEKAPLLRAHDLPPIDGAALEQELLEAGRWLAPAVCDTGRYLRAARAADQAILFEGAQGVLLDVDHGTYPFVTSSSASTGGIAPGTGLPPQSFDRVVGVAKAYATRVGSGPFPTELHGALGDRLRTAGNEYNGSTTGRPRRCGWFDAVAIRHAVAVSGATELVLTNLDVLAGFETIGVGVGYDLPTGRTSELPVFDLDGARPVLEQLPGFTGELGGMRRFEELPSNARAYVDAIEELAGIRVSTISVGPARQQVIAR